MRRAWLLAALLPSLAVAQTTPTPTEGTVTFDNAFLSSTECSTGGDIFLSWWIRPVSGAAQVQAGGQMQVFASNTQDTAVTCPPANATGRTVGSVGSVVTNYTVTSSGPQVVRRQYNTRDFATAAGISCATAADTPIYVCVRYTAPGAATGTVSGVAREVLTLSTGGPAAPVDVSVTAGDGALNVSWSDPGGDVEIDEYEAVATSADPTDPGPHFGGRGTATNDRLEGLVNGVTYDVVVFAYSKAGTQSPPSETKQGTPQPVDDFWETYRARGGPDQGGCASGAAGPAALLAAAFLLAILRRRT